MISLATPALAEAGDGVKGENFVLHLSASAGTNFNSNLFYQQENTMPALAAVVTPGLSLASVNTDKVALSLDWGLSWTQYLSGERVLLAQSGLSTHLGAAAHFNQAGNVSFRLEENLQRTNEPPNGADAEAINRFNNRLGGIVGIHPGGRALQGYLSYHWNSINFSNANLNLDEANRDEHDIAGKFIWQFRPRTAALIRASYTLVNYDQAERSLIGATTMPNFNSRPLRITAGLNGLILRNVSVDLAAGYGRADYQGGPSYSGFIGNAIFSYFLRSNEQNKVTLGYTRSFRDSLIGNFVLEDRVELAYIQPLIEDRLSFDLGAFYARRNYNLQPQTASSMFGESLNIPADITDNRYGGGLGLDFTPKKWLSVNGGYSLNANSSDDNVEIISVVNGRTQLAGRSYLQHIVSASVTATY